MIDGGPSYSYRHKERGRMKPGALQDKLDELKSQGKAIDLMIITHVDEDHIGGIKAWFEHDLTGDIHRGSSGTILSPTPKARPLQAHSRRDGYQPGSVQPRNRFLR